MTGQEAMPPVGLVLAGGESRRLGSDKARLEGAALPLDAMERLAAVCAEVAVADRGRELVPGRRSLADGPGRGPAAGILGGAAAYPGRPLLVLACDLPRVPARLLAELARSAAADWVVPRWEGGLEPLCAFYGSGTLAILAARVREGRFSLHDLAIEAGLTVRYLEGEALLRFGDPGEIFFNLNTPGDLARWREA
ncbi:MAG TPA: NTP transferase domain-containing protein [Thermoanaerobaculia bacterium]|jgi:molybdopterin-guanine dinucleotide biosynthesis protein A|nr:NTP transferase domain-containing protein [Thermoanaerobaculia bacterium]